MPAADRTPMRILHAIHDFLPRHRAGSEIYACDLAREQSTRHDVFVLAAEYDPATPHGTLRWREYNGLTVIEVVNNWEFRRFEDTYASERVNAQLRHVLAATSPDVLHVHNLLNLSFDLPRLARARGIATVATLHDYALVCASGGQRVHVAEAHVCDTIDTARCARCFNESAFSRQLAAGQVIRRGPEGMGGRLAQRLNRIAPALAARAARVVDRRRVGQGDIHRRLAYARHVLDTIDLFVAPSASMGEEFARLGVPADRIEVSDYGFVIPPNRIRRRRAPAQPLRIGFVGTLVWHKGVHVLVDAVHALSGPFEVHIHGDTNVFPEYVAGLRKAARGGVVTFHGGFGPERAPEIYEAIDVLVVPSLWPENSPLVIHEAFMHSVPVVAARAGGMPALVRDGLDGLLYEPFSADALCGCLQRLFDDRALVETLARHVPPVKTIAADAREWDARYRQLAPRPASSVTTAAV
jgi:glycosyltransferase involved in cell wall biosynthesis